ncbi:MAG: hypothetical protein WEB19_02675, partial [Acidimicrobiia bacterium]
SHWIPVSIVPHARGEYALVEGGQGKVAVSLHTTPFYERFGNRYSGPRFVAHRLQCNTPTLKRADHLGKKWLGGNLTADEQREAIRERMVRFDRSRYSGDSELR